MSSQIFIPGEKQKRSSARRWTMAAIVIAVAAGIWWYSEQQTRKDVAEAQTLVHELVSKSLGAPGVLAVPAGDPLVRAGLMARMDALRESAPDRWYVDARRGDVSGADGNARVHAAITVEDADWLFVRLARDDDGALEVIGFQPPE